MISYYMPTNIVISDNAISNLEAHKSKKFFIISGKESLTRSNLGDIIKKTVTCVGIFSGIKTNPNGEQAEEIASLIKESGADILLSVGGGSVHDTAKAAQILLNNPERVFKYTVDVPGAIDAIKKPSIPLITIPTICGTGAEISPASLVIIDSAKKIIFSPFLYPSQTLIDTNHIFHGSTKTVAASTAYDAFVQGLEAFVSIRSNYFSDTLAVAAIKTTIEYLPKLLADINNKKFREYIAIAAIQSLLAVTMADVGAIHALSDPLSARKGLHHGQALAIVSSGVIKENYHACSEKYNYVSKLLSDNFSDIPSTIKLYNSLPLFLQKIGLTNSVQDSIFSDSDNISTFVDESFNPDMTSNPCKLSKDAVKKIFISI